MSIQSIEESKARFLKLFNDTDTDCSGCLSLDEFKSMLEKGGYKFTQEELKRNFMSLDVDGDNTISLQEFLHAMTGIPLVDHRRAMWRKAFISWDKDLSGDVDREELRHVFQEVVGTPVTEKQLDTAFKRLDSDGSGKIGWEEFADYFSSL